MQKSDKLAQKTLGCKRLKLSTKPGWNKHNSHLHLAAASWTNEPGQRRWPTRQEALEVYTRANARHRV